MNSWTHRTHDMTPLTNLMNPPKLPPLTELMNCHFNLCSSRPHGRRDAGAPFVLKLRGFCNLSTAAAAFPALAPAVTSPREEIFCIFIYFASAPSTRWPSASGICALLGYKGPSPRVLFDSLWCALIDSSIRDNYVQVWSERMQCFLLRCTSLSFIHAPPWLLFFRHWILRIS